MKHERVAGVDVHKDMIKVAVRVPGPGGTRATEVLEFRTFYGVLQAVAVMLRLERGVTHVAMEATGVYAEPVYHALCEQPFTEVLVVNPRDVKALKGHKTDARDCRRIAELLECGLLRGSYVPSAEQKEMRDLTRYRKKTVQARTSEIQRLHKVLESAGIKLGSVVSELTGVSATAMIDALIDGERRPAIMADLARRSLRQAGKQADLQLALAGRFTGHHATLCRMHRDQIKLADHAVKDLDDQINAMAAARWQRELDLLVTIPGFGPVVAAAWLGEIGPAPHRWFSGHDKLAAWASMCPGNHISAGKRRSGRTGNAGTYIKPMLIEAAWGAIRVRGRLQARYRRLVRRFGGEKNPGAKKKAITAIAHTLLKIAYQVLKTGKPCTDPGADFYTRRESAASQQAWLIRRLETLNPGAVITITPPPAAAADPAPASHPGAPPGKHAA